MSAQMNRQDAPEISMATFAELDKHNSGAPALRDWERWLR